MKTIIQGKPCRVRLEEEVERIKSYWGLWTCTVEFEDGSEITGSIQSDEHMCAPETFEEE